MKVLAYGEIMEGGASVFHSIARVDGPQLFLTFEGVIRTDNPYRHLSGYLADLANLLPKLRIERTTIDFVNLKFCNSNGFYVIMDIVDTVYNLVPGPITVRRIRDDDWQQETLPILLNSDEEPALSRTSFEDVREL
jgi:hypothetical protein